MELTKSMEDYLRLIYELELDGEEVGVSALAGRLGISAPSVTGMSPCLHGRSGPRRKPRSGARRPVAYRRSSRGEPTLTPEIKRALKGGGHRLTSPRRFVVWELERSRRPLSAEQLRGRVKRRYPQVSLSTVYRTLKLLEMLGVAHRESFGECYSRYELRTGKPCHYALCLSCGAVIECHEALLDYVALRLERRSYSQGLRANCLGYSAPGPVSSAQIPRQLKPIRGRPPGLYSV